MEFALHLQRGLSQLSPTWVSVSVFFLTVLLACVPQLRRTQEFSLWGFPNSKNMGQCSSSAEIKPNAQTNSKEAKYKPENGATPQPNNNRVDAVHGTKGETTVQGGGGGG